MAMHHKTIAEMAWIASGILFGKVSESRLYSLALNSKMTPFSFRRLDYFD